MAKQETINVVLRAPCEGQKTPYREKHVQVIRGWHDDEQRSPITSEGLTWDYDLDRPVLKPARMAYDPVLKKDVPVPGKLESRGWAVHDWDGNPDSPREKEKAAKEKAKKTAAKKAAKAKT